MRVGFMMAILGMALLFVPLAAQSQGGASRADHRSTRTPWGDPDLQGTYNVATQTPLERPESAGGKLSVAKEELERIRRDAGAERARVAKLARESNPELATANADVGGQDFDVFPMDGGSTAFMIDGQYRTSIIIDPPDGKIPSMTPEGQSRDTASGGLAQRPDNAERQFRGQSMDATPNFFHDPEQRSLWERCIVSAGATSGPPILPNYFYNNMKQIVQTPNAVMILAEMIHEARIVRLTDQRLPSYIRKWNGDSIGRWEGDTLVVETTNFTNKTRYQGSTENLKVTERIRRLDADTLLYHFTIEDSSTWARPWSGEYPWVRSDDRVHEYACHEGNHSFGGIIRGARLLEKERESRGGAEQK